MNDNKKKSYSVTMILLIISISLAFFGGYLHDTYQTDTYSMIFYPYRDGYLKMIKDQGRYAQWFYFTPWFLFRKNPASPGIQAAIALSVNGCIVFSVWKIMMDRLRLAKYGDAINLLLMLLLISMRINVFETDIIQYGYFATVTFLGDAFALAAAIIIQRRTDRPFLLVSCICLIISTNFMQPSIWWFILYSIIFVYCDYLEGHDAFSLPKEILRHLTVYLVACFWQLFIFGFIIKPQAGRGDLSQINIKNTLCRISQTLLWLWKDCMGVMPRYFYSIGCLTGLILLVYLCANQSGQKKEKRHSALIVLSLIGALTAIFTPCIVDEWIPHRTISGYMALLPLICLFCVLLLFNTKTNKSKFIFYVISIIATSNLCVNWYYSTKLYKQQVIVNTIDQENVRFYFSIIEEYEAHTGIAITKLARGFDQNPTYVLPDTMSPKSMNDRAMETSWGFRDIFPFVTGRRFDMVDFDPHVFKEYFEGKDWDTISRDQVVCIGNTAYIVWY